MVHGKAHHVEAEYRLGGTHARMAEEHVMVGRVDAVPIQDLLDLRGILPGLVRAVELFPGDQIVLPGAPMSGYV